MKSIFGILLLDWTGSLIQLTSLSCSQSVLSVCTFDPLNVELHATNLSLDSNTEQRQQADAYWSRLGWSMPCGGESVPNFLRVERASRVAALDDDVVPLRCQESEPSRSWTNLLVLIVTESHPRQPRSFFHPCQTLRPEQPGRDGNADLVKAGWCIVTRVGPLLACS